jgi:hypothetical protein
METSVLISLAAEVSEKLFRVLVESWSGSRSKDKKQARVDSWLKKNYDKLHDAVTDDSVRLLANVEFGHGLTIKSGRKLLYPNTGLSTGKLKLLDQEFRYRLEFLVLLGLLQRGMRDYRITRLGVAFLAMARTEGHYETVLKVN